MTDRKYGIRVGIDGKADINRDFDDIAQKGDASFAAVEKSAQRASDAISNISKSAQSSAAVLSQGGQVTGRDAFDRQIARLKAEQDALTTAQARAQAQTSFSNFMGIDRHGSETAGDAAQVFTDYADRAERLRAELDPLGAAQENLTKKLADYDSMEKGNLLTHEQRLTLEARAQKEFKQTKDELAELGNETANGTTRAREMAMGLAHLAEGATTGSFSTRQLAMSIGDISRASSGPGGVLGAFKEMGTLFATQFAPVVLTVGSVAAVLALTGSIITTNAAATRQLQAGTEGLGRASGATAGELSVMARNAADAGHQTIGAARDTAVALSETGVIGREQILGLTALTEDYARKTDTNMDKARETIVGAFRDPAKAGLELAGNLGQLDDRTSELIKRLQAQGDYTGAQTVLQTALNRELSDSTDKTTAWGNALDYLKQKWSEVVDSFRSNTVAEQRAEIVGTIEALRQAGLEPGSYASDLVKFDREHGAELAAERAKADKDRADQEAQRVSRTAGPVIRGVLPGYEDRQSLNTAASNLSSLMGNADALKHLGVTAEQAAQAYDSIDRALTTYLDDDERAASATSLQIEALSHFTVAQRANDAALQVRLELSGKGMKAEQELTREHDASRLVYAAAAREIASETIQLDMNRRGALAAGDAYLKSATAGTIAEARAKASAEAFRDGVNVETRARQILAEQVAQNYAAGARQIEQLHSHSDAQKQINDAVAAGTLNIGAANDRLQTELALRPLLIAQALAEGSAKEKLATVIARLRIEYANDNEEARRNQALRTIASQNDQLELLKREIDLQGESESARRGELADLRAKQQLQQQNIAADSQEGKQIIANAGELELFQQKLELINASRNEVVGMFDTIVSDLRTGGDLAGDLREEFLKLAALNPIKNTLFGANLPTLDSVKGIVGQMFGGAKSFLGEGWDMLAGVLHRGGMPANANEFRTFPANVVDSVPRRHTGYNPLKPGESLNVLLNTERVLNPQETRAYNAGMAAGGTGGGSGGPTENHFHLEGSVVTSDLIRQMNRIGEVLGNRAIKTARTEMGGWQEDKYYEAG